LANIDTNNETVRVEKIASILKYFRVFILYLAPVGIYRKQVLLLALLAIQHLSF